MFANLVYSPHTNKIILANNQSNKAKLRGSNRLRKIRMAKLREN